MQQVRSMQSPANTSYTPQALRQKAADGESAALEQLLSSHPNWLNDAGPSTGNTALHQAALRDRIFSIHVLIKHHADPTLKNKEGNTAEDLATGKTKLLLQSYRIAMCAMNCILKYPLKDPLVDDNRLKYNNEYYEFSKKFRDENLKPTHSMVLKKPSKKDDEVLNNYRINAIQLFTCLQFIEAQAKEGKQIAGTCGVTSQLLFAKLLTENLPFPIEIILVEIQKDVNHAFVVINRDQDSPINDPSQWGNSALFCDPYRRFKLYPILCRPTDSVLNNTSNFGTKLELNRALTYAILCSNTWLLQTPTLPDEVFIKSLQEDFKNKSITLYRSIDSKLNKPPF
jgi:hypothetical protein